MDALKSELAGEDFDAIKATFDKLVTSQQKLGEAIYANAPAEGEGEAAGEGASEEDVVDAEVVEEEDDKK